MERINAMHPDLWMPYTVTTLRISYRHKRIHDCWMFIKALFLQMLLNAMDVIVLHGKHWRGHINKQTREQGWK